MSVWDCVLWLRHVMLHYVNTKWLLFVVWDDCDTWWSLLLIRYTVDRYTLRLSLQWLLQSSQVTIPFSRVVYNGNCSRRWIPSRRVEVDRLGGVGWWREQFLSQVRSRPYPPSTQCAVSLAGEHFKCKCERPRMPYRPWCAIVSGLRYTACFAHCPLFDVHTKHQSESVDVDCWIEDSTVSTFTVNCVVNVVVVAVALLIQRMLYQCCCTCKQDCFRNFGQIFV